MADIVTRGFSHGQGHAPRFSAGSVGMLCTSAMPRVRDLASVRRRAKGQKGKRARRQEGKKGKRARKEGKS